jgi:hypothetical protein
MNPNVTMTRSEFKKLQRMQQFELVREHGRRIIGYENGVMVYLLFDFAVAVHPRGLTMTFVDSKMTVPLFCASSDDGIAALKDYSNSCLDEQDYEEAANIRNWITRIHYENLVKKLAIDNELNEADRLAFSELYQQLFSQKEIIQHIPAYQQQTPPREF